MQERSLTKGQRREAMARRVMGRINDVPTGVDAKGWAETPEVVRRAIWRRLLELRDGYAKQIGTPAGSLDDDATFAEAQARHARAVQVIEDIRMQAEASGTTLPEVCERYFGMHALWQRDPLAGLVEVCRNLGVDPRSMGQALMHLDGGRDAH